MINIGNFMGKMQPLVNSILVAQLVRSKITAINVKNVMQIRKTRTQVINLVNTSMLVVRVVITEIHL